MTARKRSQAVRKIGRLLLRHLRASERGKHQFDLSGAALDAALALGVPLDQPIPLPDGRMVSVRDQFAGGRNTAFAAKMFQRFKVESVRGARLGRDAMSASAPSISAGTGFRLSEVNRG